MGSAHKRRWRVGVDVGGTFTDIALVDEGTGAVHVHKVPTLKDELVRTVTTGVAESLAESDISPSDVAYVAVGSTTALNTVIELTGCQAGLVVTKGYRDVLEIRRTRLPDAPSFNARRPVPLIRRAMVAEVDERMHVSGQAIRPLDEEDLIAATQPLVEAGVEALAICFLHAYRNAEHEHQASKLVRKRWPHLYVSVSSEVWPQQREYERALLTAMNAYIGPQMHAYYENLQDALRALGLVCPVLVTQSNGGMLDIEDAARTPVRTILSGPAGGVTGAAKVGQRLGKSKLFTFDMGGTSADMALVDDQPRLGTESHVGDYPLFMPAVSIDTIGAGGGSIAWRDPQGVLKVGPRSAGAYPGPACYDRGGTQPTVTDAYVYTGIIGETDLLGGAMRISRANAERAISELANELGLSTEEAADGIIRVATANMYAELLPLIARHGADYTQYSLMAYGGAGPVHAFMLAGEAGIPSVVVPEAPGAMSAVGAALTDLQMDFVASGHWHLSETQRIDERFRALEAEGERWLHHQGLDRAGALFLRTADLRYSGQSYEITVPLESGAPQSDEFHRRYEEIYGYCDKSQPLEVLQLRLLVQEPNPTPERQAVGPTAQSQLQPVEVRRVAYSGTHLEVPVYRRHELPEGMVIDGPAILIQYDTTTFVTPEFKFWQDPDSGVLEGVRK